MATRNQVLSLFGATPAQIQEKQRREEIERIQQSQSRYGRAGASFGSSLGRMFGRENTELALAQQMQKATAGIDPNDPKALRELATAVSQFAPERALQIAAYAGELEKSQRPNMEYREVVIGYSKEPVIDPLTLKPTGQFTSKPIKDTAIIQDGKITGYTSGRGMSTDGSFIPGITALPEGQAPPPPTVNQRWNAEKGVMEEVTPVRPQEVIETVPPSAQQQINLQSGASRSARTGETGVGIAPPPKIQGEVEFMNPDVLNEEIASLEEKLKGLPRTAKSRKDLEKEIRKLKAERNKFKKKGSQQRGRNR